MRKSLTRQIILCVVLLLAACATMPGGLTNLEHVRTVGLVSAIGSKFSVQKVGLTAFTNDLKEIPIDSWGIDEYVAGKTRAMLNRRYDVRPTTHNKAPFAPRRFRASADLVRTDVSPQGLDAYIVIETGSDQYAETNQILHGLGIVEGQRFGPNYYGIFALYRVAIIDGHEFKLIGDTYASLPAERGTWPLHGLHRDVDQSWWPASLDAASNPKFNTVVHELIDRSLPGTLQKLQLTN